MQGTSVVRSWSIREDERSVVRRRGEDVSGSLERELLKLRLEARVSSGIRWCWCETAKDGLCLVAEKLHESGRDYTSQGAGEE